MKKNVTPEQFRSARAHRGFSLKDVAAGAKLSVATISQIERGDMENPRANTIEALVTFYERSGVGFTDDNGIAELRTYIQPLSGQAGLRTFFDNVYEVAAATKDGDFTIFNGMPSELIHHAGEDWYKAHAARMTEVRDKYNFRVIVEHGETNFIGNDFVTYKWFPKDEFDPCTIYTFGDWVGFLTFDNEVNIMVVREKTMAKSQRAMFNRVWEYAKDIPRDVYQL